MTIRVRQICIILCLVLLGVTAEEIYDSCDSAYSIQKLPFTVDSTTTVSEISQFYCSISPIYTAGKGVYYMYTPAMDTTLAASTCGETTLDTTLYVFTECYKGIAQQCLSYNDDSCGTSSEVRWNTTAGETYYIFVTGFGKVTGDFSFTLTDEGEKNDLCTLAEEISSLPFTFTGDNDKSETVTSGCRNMDAVGLWFVVLGTGKDLKASTCENSQLDTIIELYSDCSGTCINFVDDTCLWQSEIVWPTLEGVPYYIFVSSPGLLRGQFTLSVMDVAEKIISLPYTTAASTANTPSTYSSCFSVQTNSLWYVVAGTGEALTAWTCVLDNLSGDTTLQVYEECDENAVAQSCVTANDDFCGLHSKVEWSAEADKYYYIAVSGYRSGSDGVAFTLSVDTLSNVDNSVCWNAEPVTTLPMTFSQTTSNAEFTEGDCATDSSLRQGRWFSLSFATSVSNILATVCNDDTILPFSIEVYNLCSPQHCVRQSDPLECSGKGSVQFQALGGQSYWIFVTAGVNVTGDFRVDFSEISPDPYCECATAYPLVVPETYQGDTTNACMSFSPCNLIGTTGLWFSVLGTGNQITASTCTSYTEFDTIIAVARSCAEITDNCIVWSDDWPTCGVQSQVSWDSELGTPYYILVSGWKSEYGLFELTVTDSSTNV
ncbi:hypothetical protein Pelo_16271 [Pelomyxa schiedti]|nr:hypothetical protein Pelo_16271 [Pelomyxa schiedti]